MTCTSGPNMKQLQVLTSLLSAIVIASAWMSASAQQSSGAPMPAMAASMPMDCAKPPVKRHDHGAEKGLGVSASKSTDMACAQDGAASESAKGKKKVAHDHAKFHKNQ